MQKLNSLDSEKDLPEHLYHYTSIGGLEGILTTRSLWASQIHFLNDIQEFKYSVDIFKKVLSKLRKDRPRLGLPPRLPTEPQEVLAYMYSSIEDFLSFDLFDKMPICVFSFSEEGDLLSQWRGYCPSGGGYSIGFRPEQLIQFLKVHDLYIKPCIYDEIKQEAIVYEVVTKTGDILLKKLTGAPGEFEKVAKESIYHFFIDFSIIASTLKHPSFYEECEWRIVSNLIPNKYMSFRIGKSMLIPYFSICFKDTEPFPIDEIIIGPTPEQHLAESSLRQFVLRNNLNISIKPSKTPYRAL